MSIWIATGSSLNLRTSLEKGRWGVSKRLKNTWERVAQSDLLFFYVTSLSAALSVSLMSRAKP
jgi:predicted RNA-binding protein